MAMSKIFCTEHPYVHLKPSLREQIVVLEDLSGCIVKMNKDNYLYIDVNYPPGSVYSHLTEHIEYNLKHTECIEYGIVTWTLVSKNDYILENVVKRPELKTIIITSKNTSYRGVKLNGEVYWTNNEYDYHMLKNAISELELAQEKVNELIGAHQ